MNGRFLLDTNAVIAPLNGNSSLIQILQSANWIGISIITELEFLSFSGLSAHDEILFQQFKNRIEVIDLQGIDKSFLEHIIKIRTTNKLKLPDAIIAASALQNMATLLTLDMAFSKIAQLSFQHF